MFTTPACTSESSAKAASAWASRTLTAGGTPTTSRAFLRLALRSLQTISGRRDALHRLSTAARRPGSHACAAPTRDRDARNVRAHYDLGNEFFQHVLDETMAYSCAIFDAPGITLADASGAKFDRLAAALDLVARRSAPRDRDRLGRLRAACRRTLRMPRDDDHDLAARNTSSPTERVRAAGLEHQITVLDRDYRDLRGTFDKAVAIEMIEAVDWRDYDTFFASPATPADPTTGALAMQAIVVPDQSFDRLKRHTDFIKAAIFPGGCLPSIGALTAAANRNGLTLAQRRPHRRALRRNAATLAHQPRCDQDRTPGTRPRHPIRPALGLLPRILRSRIRRALHRRDPAPIHRTGLPRSSRHRRARTNPIRLDRGLRRPWPTPRNIKPTC